MEIKFICNTVRSCSFSSKAALSWDMNEFWYPSVHGNWRLREWAISRSIAQGGGKWAKGKGDVCLHHVRRAVSEPAVERQTLLFTNQLREENKTLRCCQIKYLNPPEQIGSINCLNTLEYVYGFLTLMSLCSKYWGS